MKKVEKKHIDFRLSLDESLIIKGIAICLMLWHHLFYESPEYGEIVFQTAKFGKLCVALFLFISGYGLTIQYNTIQYNYKFHQISNEKICKILC
jgi:peptidoglycan/LPS O-acetylase OafA/YrhL